MNYLTKEQAIARAGVDDDAYFYVNGTELASDMTIATERNFTLQFDKVLTITINKQQLLTISKWRKT